MTDREKTIKNFEYQVRKAHEEGWIFVDLLTEEGFKILDILKKLEPKKPRRDTVGEYVCPHEGCHHRLSLMLKQNYCDICGQAVKWE